MGVEEIQKINNLAKELMKHQLASSSEEAYVKAELMVKGEAPKVTREDEVNRELRTLGMNMNSLYNELVKLQHEFKSFREEFSDIKRRVENMIPVQQAQQAQQAAPAERTGEREPQQPTHTETASQPSDKKQTVRPRTGDYSEKDVAVEKFFYFGNNRK
ncbi:hypothetical protein HY640_01935 [Candidatus Woesearchaeota archaeon]|nr:hypothetical protein [Candidatus Woesearchaeota archaeon]